MVRTPGCSDTPRNEPLPFESDGRLIFQKKRGLKHMPGCLRTDWHAVDPTHTQVG